MVKRGKEEGRGKNAQKQSALACSESDLTWQVSLATFFSRLSRSCFPVDASHHLSVNVHCRKKEVKETSAHRFLQPLIRLNRPADNVPLFLSLSMPAVVVCRDLNGSLRDADGTDGEGRGEGTAGAEAARVEGERRVSRGETGK